jgi:geranylgeranyl diphosphate synthase type II
MSQHELPQLLDRIQQYARQYPFPSQPNQLYEPCEYILSLGGKRLRPALLLLGYEIFADDIEAALPAAWAIELFHNFSLVHDDIMDAAPLRRGQPTVHTRWNTTTGILSGDVMLIYAYRALAAVPDKAVIPDLLHTFNRVAIEVCEGQQMDVDFESRDAVSIPEYIRMIELKTAVLLGGALEMGALCAHADPDDARRLYEFGRLAGIAFQIQDDLLDTYGDPAKFGKQVGGDILQNKKTLLVLKTLEVASPDDQSALRQWMRTSGGDPDAKIAAVRAIFDRNNIPELIAREQQSYQKEAFRQLDEVNAPSPRKEEIRKMMNELFGRER